MCYYLYFLKLFLNETPVVFSVLGEAAWLFDVLFEWKAARPGREVLLLGGDIHVGVESVLRDARTGLSIRSISASPITNRPAVPAFCGARLPAPTQMNQFSRPVI